MNYADVILPFSFGKGIFTYSLPDDCHGVSAGARVRVSFRRKEMVGIVSRLHSDTPSYKVIQILEVIDSEPLILPPQLELLSFAAEYYMNSMGDVLRAVLPSKIRSEAFSGVKAVAYRLVTDSLKEELDAREKRKGQYRILMQYAESGESVITLSRLTKAGAGQPALKTLCAEGLLERVEVPRDVYSEAGHGDVAQLSEMTDRILREKRTSVVVGLEDASSFVSELVGHYSASGRTVLVMMPSVDEDLCKRLSGDNTVKYFSTDSVPSRTQVYLRILKCPESVDLVVGGRISVFLPISRLGHIVVLDEHDERYRGQRSPHFNGRDMAIMLSGKTGVPVTLVSSSPSLETVRNIKDGVYALEDVVRDYPVMVLEKGRDLLSKYARERMAEVLAAGKNALVFQNRRGYAGYVECTSCGYIPGCPRCSVRLGFHASERSLKCHYCGYTIPYDGKCPECKQEIVSVQGFGTERLASTISGIFPEYPVSVLDSDRQQKFDPSARIIVGTSFMIRHDSQLHDIGIVLVANADNLLIGSDFRAEEKAFRTLVSLRATAMEHGAELVIQTKDFRQPIFKSIADSSFIEYLRQLLEERRETDFPPYSRLMRLEFRHRDKDYLYRCAGNLHAILMSNVPDCNISPLFEPEVEKIDMEYILQIVIRFRKDRDGLEQKRVVSAILSKAVGDILKKLSVSVDVDPQ